MILILLLLSSAVCRIVHCSIIVLLSVCDTSVYRAPDLISCTVSMASKFWAQESGASGSESDSDSDSDSSMGAAGAGAGARRQWAVDSDSESEEEVRFQYS